MQNFEFWITNQTHSAGRNKNWTLIQAPHIVPEIEDIRRANHSNLSAFQRLKPTQVSVGVKFSTPGFCKVKAWLIKWRVNESSSESLNVIFQFFKKHMWTVVIHFLITSTGGKQNS